MAKKDSKKEAAGRAIVAGRERKSPNPPAVVEKCVILDLSTSSFGLTKQLAEDEYTVEAKAARKGPKGEADKDRTGARKRLLKCPEVQAIKGCDAAARKFILSVRVPYQLGKGRHLIPLAEVQRVERALERIKADRATKVAAAVKALPTRIADDKAALKSVWREEDYPTPEAFEREFSFDWTYQAFELPGTLEALDKQLFAKHAAEAESRWRSAEIEIQQGLAAGIVELTKRFKECLTVGPDGKPKMFHKSLISNLEEFLGVFDSRNVTNNAELKALADKARKVIQGVEVDDLRTLENEGLRNSVVKQFNAIASEASKLASVRSRKLAL